MHEYEMFWIGEHDNIRAAVDTKELLCAIAWRLSTEAPQFKAEASSVEEGLDGAISTGPRVAG